MPRIVLRVADSHAGRRGQEGHADRALRPGAEHGRPLGMARDSGAAGCSSTPAQTLTSESLAKADVPHPSGLSRLVRGGERMDTDHASRLR